jgi:hypothetical protein
MIPKLGKRADEVILLPIISKVFKKGLMKRLNPILSEIDYTNHQFGFRQQHSTIEQVHRVAKIIRKALEEKILLCCVSGYHTSIR